MWPRVVEIMLGCWMAMSPFVFAHPHERVVWWITDFGAALAMWTLGALSYWKPAQHAHWLQILVGVYLIAYGWLSAEYPHRAIVAPDYPPALQNYVLVGLLLLMFAIIPNRANRPPRAWLGT